jgi:hypothetical protein
LGNEIDLPPICITGPGQAYSIMKYKSTLNHFT